MKKDATNLNSPPLEISLDETRLFHWKMQLLVDKFDSKPPMKPHHLPTSRANATRESGHNTKCGNWTGAPDSSGKTLEMWKAGSYAMYKHYHSEFCVVFSFVCGFQKFFNLAPTFPTFCEEECQDSSNSPSFKQKFGQFIIAESENPGIFRNEKIKSIGFHWFGCLWTAEWPFPKDPWSTSDIIRTFVFGMISLHEHRQEHHLISHLKILISFFWWFGSWLSIPCLKCPTGERPKGSRKSVVVEAFRGKPVSDHRWWWSRPFHNYETKQFHLLQGSWWKWNMFKTSTDWKHNFFLT